MSHLTSRELYKGSVIFLYKSYLNQDVVCVDNSQTRKEKKPCKQNVCPNLNSQLMGVRQWEERGRVVRSNNRLFARPQL